MDWNWLEVKLLCALGDFFGPVVCAILPDSLEYNFFLGAITVLERAGATSPGLRQAFLSLVEGAENGMIISWDLLPIGKAPKGFKGYKYVLSELFEQLAKLYIAGDESCREEIRRVLNIANKVLQKRRKALRGGPDDRIRVQHEHVISLWDMAIRVLLKAMGMDDCEETADDQKKDHQNDRENGASGSKIESSKKGETSGSNQSKTTVYPTKFGTCKDEFRGGPPYNRHIESTMDSLALNSDIFYPEAYAICSEGVEFLFFKEAMTIADGARPTSSPFLPTFLALVDVSKDGIIIFWDQLPFDNPAPTHLQGYTFVIRELFNMLGLIYKDVGIFVRVSILQALIRARAVLTLRKEVFKFKHRDEQRRQDHEHVISIWEKAIEGLEQVMQGCEESAGRNRYQLNHQVHGGSGRGTTRSYLENYRSNQPPTPASLAQSWRRRHEYRWGRTDKSYPMSGGTFFPGDIRRGAPEIIFLESVIRIIDEARPTSSPLLPAFLNLLDGAEKGIIVSWGRLPLDNPAPCNFDGYEYFIPELFSMLGRIYKDGDTTVRSKIVGAVSVASIIQSTQLICVAMLNLIRQQEQRCTDHMNVISLWMDAIVRFQEVVQDCKRTAGRKMDHQNYQVRGGSGSGSARSSYECNYEKHQQTISTRRDIKKSAVVIAGGTGLAIAMNSMATTAAAAKTACVLYPAAAPAILVGKALLCTPVGILGLTAALCIYAVKN